MGPVEVSWIRQKCFVGVDSTQHSVVLSAGDDLGVKPPEAMLISLATCALCHRAKERLDLGGKGRRLVSGRGDDPGEDASRQ